jgi:predicted DCC family thiol-disulfide oxidoreductase YuxK
LFKEQLKTNFPPAKKSVMVWDGECGFCHYWIIRWKIITGDKIEYKPFQKTAHNYPDVPEERFREAVRLLEPDGSISSGPAAAFRSFYLTNKYKWLFPLYQRSPIFKKLSDYVYQVMADNRAFFLKVTRALFGKNPRKPKPYWMLFLLLLAMLFFIIFSL